MIGNPAGVKRGHMVNRFPASQWHQRHDASHFDTKTQDKLVPELSKILLLRQNNPSGGARFCGCRRTTSIERLELLSRLLRKALMRKASAVRGNSVDPPSNEFYI